MDGEIRGWVPRKGFLRSPLPPRNLGRGREGPFTLGQSPSVWEEVGGDKRTPKKMEEGRTVGLECPQSQSWRPPASRMCQLVLQSWHLPEGSCFLYACSPPQDPLLSPWGPRHSGGARSSCSAGICRVGHSDPVAAQPRPLWAGTASRPRFPCKDATGTAEPPGYN